VSIHDQLERIRILAASAPIASATLQQIERAIVKVQKDYEAESASRINSIRRALAKNKACRS
jgi:hypothetical protein